MEQRQAVEADVVAVVAEHPLRRVAEGHRHFVAVHDALRQARGPRGVEDHGQVGTARRAEQRRGGRELGAGAQGRDGLAGIDVQQQAAGRFPEAGADRGGRRVLEHDRGRGEIVQLVTQHAPAQVRVQGRGRGAEPAGAEERPQELDPVAAHDRDPIAKPAHRRRQATTRTAPPVPGARSRCGHRPR